MIHELTCAINTNDKAIMQQFKDRLPSAKIKAIDLASPNSKYTYLSLQWDDTDIPAAQKHHGNSHAGAKPKKLLYEGKPVTCGLVWHLREQEHLSDAAIGGVLDASESTIARRRKKHLADGNFHADSVTIF